MQRNTFYRSLVSIGSIAMFWFAPVPVRSAELLPLVVTGIALDKVATVHPTPEYPRDAIAFRLSGKVRIELKVQNGRITQAKALSGSPTLAYSAESWIVRNWKFKPQISGVFTVPIDYQRQA